MATVYKKPDTLSFSGNLKKFEMTSDTNVHFKLLKESDVLIDHIYEPGEDNRIIIDVRQIVESSLEFKLSTGEINYIQDKIAADFVADIDGTQFPFRAIRTGVSNLADTPENWLKLHFLTWQPTNKMVTYYSPEWLTYYAVVPGNLKIHARFDDGTDSEKVLQTCTAGKAYTVNTQYAIVAGLFANKLPMYYDVYFSGNDGLQISETQRYIADSPISEDETWILWENSLGGYDTARVAGINTLEADHTHNIATVDDISFEYDVDIERRYTKNTGFLNKYQRQWLLDFFPAKNKYIHSESNIRKIVVIEDNVTYKSNDLPSSYTFTYKFAESGSFLNLQKRNDLPAGLTIPVPSLPDFSLPPRIVEYPRIPLSEGVLLPVQDPNSDHIGITSLGALKNFIILGLDESGLSIIETLKDWASDQFLSKVQQDSAKEIITFEKGLRIGNSIIREINGVLTFSESIASEKSVSARGASTSTGSGTLTSLGDLVDVNDTGKIPGSILMFNGTHWVVEDGSNISPDLTGYATENWVNEQGYLKSQALADYATKTYVNDRISDIVAGAPEAFDTLKEIADVLYGNVDSIGDIITTLGTKWTQDNTKIANWNTAFGWGDHAVAGYLTAAEFATYFKKDSQGRIYTDFDFYSTKSVSARGASGSSGSGTLTSLGDLVDVNDTGKAPGKILTFNGTHWVCGDASGGATDLTGYATENWVNAQGFIKALHLTGYATESWVNSQSFLKASNLTGYATQVWVNSQGFLKQNDVNSKVDWNGNINASAFPNHQIGYGFAAMGWYTSGPAMAFGSGAYTCQIQQAIGTTGLLFRTVYNNAPSNWYTIYNSGNSNLSTIDWSAKNLTAVGNIHSTNGYLISTAQGCTLTIGSVNPPYIHFIVDPARYFYFNNAIEVAGTLHPHINNTYSTGLPTHRWSNVYSVYGSFSSDVNVGGKLAFPTGNNIKGNNSSYIGFFTSGDTACPLAALGITLSDNYADISKRPAYGIYSKGGIVSAGTISTSGVNLPYTTPNILTEGIFRASNAIVGIGQCTPILTWSSQLPNGGGYITRFGIGSFRDAPYWGKMYFAMGNNDQGTSSVNHYMDASGIHATGYFTSTLADCTLTIGALNTTYVYFSASPARTFYFSNTVDVNGSIYPHANSVYTLGTFGNKWGNVISVDGDFSGSVNVANSLIFGGGNYIMSDRSAYVGFLTSGNAACPIAVGGITVSDHYGDVSKKPAYGIYSKGEILSASNIKAAGSVTARTASDIRLKENIRTIDNAIGIIGKLTPFYYTWKQEAFAFDSGLRQGYDIGLSAQDVKKYLPAASISMWDHYLGIDYSKITPLLVAGMHEFATWKDEKDIEIEQLKKRIETLENQLKAA